MANSGFDYFKDLGFLGKVLNAVGYRDDQENIEGKFPGSSSNAGGKNSAATDEPRTRRNAAMKDMCSADNTDSEDEDEEYVILDEDDHDEDDEDYYMEKIQDLVNLRMSGMLNEEQEDYYDNKAMGKKKKGNNLNNNRRLIIDLPVVENAVTARLKDFITNELKGTDLKLVIQKPLFNSDIKNGQNRFNMPPQQLRTQDFLTPAESQELERGKELKVVVYGPTLEKYDEPIMLKRWRVNNNRNYVLIKNWSKFIEEHKRYFEVNTLVQAWSFHMRKQLCFGIVAVGKVGGRGGVNNNAGE